MQGRYRWNGKELAPASGPTLDLLVADSFLLDEGRVVAPQLHRDRFLRDAQKQGMVHPPHHFLAAAWSGLPQSGRWFPRLDLTERGELEVWVRPAPELTRTLSVWITTEDPRTTPPIKGPDIPALTELRDRAGAAGAAEAVMVDSRGLIRDGATTCLVWWRDDTLWIQPPGSERVDSVTVRVIRHMAAARGVSVREGSARFNELSASETWALNALHGIRGVEGWIPGPHSATMNGARLDEWRRDYQERFEKISETGSMPRE